MLLDGWTVFHGSEYVQTCNLSCVILHLREQQLKRKFGKHNVSPAFI